MPRMRSVVTLVCAVALLLCIVSPVSAQVNASVGGTVSDATGAIIPKVDLTARNVNTGIVTKGVTNDTGSYTFASLQPGSYTVSAAFMGFQTQTFNNVELGEGQQVRLNFTLQPATGAQAVEVTAEADTLVATTTASVGGVLANKEVLNLPVASRNVLDLVQLTPGVVTSVNAFGAVVPQFAGTAIGSVNTTRDGMVTNDGRYNSSNGAYSAAFTSPDLVEEVRVSTNSIDPALGRGSAQVQMRTRSGSNGFHGALFYTNNNSNFNAANYFNNLVGAPKDYNNRNQFGGRLGGPIKKNKAFFFVLVDDQRYLERVNVVSTVLTGPARQGIFRYLTSGSPGGTARRNGNATSTTPSVDLAGNVLTSANGVPLYMNSINLFTQVGDPNRTGIDPIWFGPQYLGKYMPMPNNYTVGDGLNTAGFQWQRTDSGIDGATGQSANPNRNHITLRFDYNINDKNKVNFVMTKEHDYGVTGQTGLPDYPAGYFGDVQRYPNFYTAAWTYTITPTILNEFRFGYKQDTWQGTSPLDLGCCWGASENSGLASTAQTARASFPQLNGSFLYSQPGTITTGYVMGLYAGMNVSSPRQTLSPFYQYGDNVSWFKGKHSFQFGFEIDRTSSNSANSGGAQTTRPFVTLGVGGVGVPNITPGNFAGLSTSDVSTAQNLLANLAGSVASIQEQFYVNNATQTNWTNYTNDFLFYRNNHSNMWAGFAKDSWKVTRDLTVNLGLRYDWYGAPYQTTGLGGKTVGGQAGLFGISGTNFSNTGTPYTNSGQLTNTVFVGPGSPNPGQQVYNNYWKAFGPSVGIAWNLPWFKRNTILRAGYGINYAFGSTDFLSINTNIGNLPGQTYNATLVPSTYLSLANLPSNIVPLPTTGVVPFSAVPLNCPTCRTGPLVGYQDNLRTPYIQSFNVQVQRELTRTTTFDVSYIGNKASRLLVNQQLNDEDLYYNGFLDAFNVTRAGGNAPLFNQMLTGLTIPGVGTVNGTSLTGSQALRQLTTTNALIANGSVAGLANFLNTTTTATGTAGGILVNGNLPQQFFVRNPQFGSVQMVSNNGNSTYNSVQAHVAQRILHGLTGQFSYTFSKTLGDNGVYRDQNNFGLSKSLVPIDRTHVFQGNFVYEPFGGKSHVFGQAWTRYLVQGWQVSSGFSWVSGIPLSFTTTDSTLCFYCSNTADKVGALPSTFGQVLKGNGFVSYFPSLTNKLAPLPNFGGNTNLAGVFSNQVVVDNSGNTLFQNPSPGSTGNTPLNLAWARGPGQLGLNGAVAKVFAIREGWNITLRADLINILNKPQWGNPVTNINSATFGRITTATGNRTVTFNARLDF